MPSQHAILSPSAAHRWLHCTAAPLLEKDMPDSSSTFAEEGTLAHAYCAKKLKEILKQDTSDEEREIAELNEEYHTGEMDEYTDTYMTIVMEKLNAAKKHTKDSILMVEVQLDFSKWIPKGFGTSDAVIISDGTMEVIDFKYGKGVKVSAEENPQMMIYALGAYERFSFEYDIEKVRMTIVQPRIDNLSEFDISVKDLIGWANKTLAPKAKEAISGKGHQDPGKWCQFCKVKAQCKALATKCVKTVESHPKKELISKEDMESIILPILPTIKTWLSGIEEYSLNQALEGVEYKGYKIVEGRSNRKITKPEEVMKVLSEGGYAEESYMKPRELKTLTDLEKLIGKKRFATMCGDYIFKPQGKPTLVPESDKRPAYNAAADDFKDINVK